MRRVSRFAVASVVSIAAVVALAIPAAAHEITEFSLSCSTVSATLTTDNPDIHPVTWNVKVGDGEFVAVPTTETHIGPVDQDVTVVTADISALTAALQGQTTTVQAFLSWAALPNGDQTFSGTVTCGTPPTPPPTPPPVVIQVLPVVAIPAPVTPTIVVAAPVPASARFTG
jgi:hypothetical protein